MITKLGTAEERLRSIQAFHRGESSPFISFKMPIDILMDGEHCSEITRRLEQIGSDWERRFATTKLWEMIPEEPGLYMFVWSPQLHMRLAAPPDVQRFSWVLYIGEAGGEVSNSNLRTRYRNEYATYIDGDPEELWATSAVDDRRALLQRYLTLQPLEYWFLTISDPTVIKPLERKLIRILNPPLNIQGGPRLQTGKPQAAW